MILISAGDAITAKLIKEAGFAGIWVSGFEVCARMGLPDNGSLTMTEMINNCKPIVEAVDLPVYVDVDTGYGNFERTINEFTKIGIAGICVEDNLPNKENSLWGGQRPLMHMDDFANKINVKHPKLKIIARTEALIRRYTMTEAIQRVMKYEKAGADTILIHTRDCTGEEALEISKRARKYITKPLAIVPTRFPHFTNKQLYDMGFKMIIWANQMERMKIKAVRNALEIIKKCDCALPIDQGLSATLEDMRGLMPDGNT